MERAYEGCSKMAIVRVPYCGSDYETDPVMYLSFWAH